MYKRLWQMLSGKFVTITGVRKTGCPRLYRRLNAEMYCLCSYICIFAVVMVHFFPCRKNGKDREGAFQVAGLDSTAHTFQEYTYKKITPCDVCLQVLRGASTYITAFA